MSNLDKFKAEANSYAKSADHTPKDGGGDYVLPPAGQSMARLVDYIEVGLQPQRAYEGKEKKPARKVILTFELLSPKYVREIEVNGKKKTIADRIKIDLPLFNSTKSAFSDLFERMRAGRTEITNMAQMIGEAFKVVVHHSEPDSKGKVYANLRAKGKGYDVGPPVRTEEDDEGNVLRTVKIKVIDAVSPIRMFLFDQPTALQWASIYIEGDREVKDEKGKTKKVSNNWIQELIMKALDFKGSPAEALIEGSEELPDDPEDLEEEFEEDVEVEETEDEDEAETEEEDAEDTEEVEDEEEEEEEKTAPKKATKPTAKEQLAAKKAPAKAAAKPAAKAPAKTGKPASDKTTKNAMAALGLDD